MATRKTSSKQNGSDAIQVEELLERLERLERAVGELAHDLHGVAGSEQLLIAGGGRHHASAQLLAIHEERLKDAGIAPQTGLPDPQRKAVLPSPPGYTQADYERAARMLIAKELIENGIPVDEAVRQANSTKIKPPRRGSNPEAVLTSEGVDPRI